jgi:hypothetical protein
LIEGVKKDRLPDLGFGFKIVNGPDEVTISECYLTISYEHKNFGALIWDKETIILEDIRSDEFAILGIKGPAPGFRLRPRDEVTWRFPSSASNRFLGESTEESVRDDSRRQIKFTFRVVASGNVVCSKPFLPSGVISNTLLGFRHTAQIYGRLESLVLSVLAQDALPGLRAMPASTLSAEAEQIIKQYGAVARDVPGDFRKWIVDLWENEGHLGNETTEEFARSLARFRQQPLEG